MKPHEKCRNDLNHDEITRYARHLSLPEIGSNGQRKIKASSVICIGTGGLGSPLLLYLAAAGVGRLGIVDFDRVELSNLQRQIIHKSSTIQDLKTKSAKERILEVNPHCKVKTFNTILDKDNAIEILKNFDIICDCTDNFPSRYLINDACLILNKPNIYGSVAGFEGQVSVFNLEENSPNYRDLVPIPPPSHLIPSCEEGGVLGVVPGLVGLIQATEVIKIITGIGNNLSGRVLVFNALTMKFKELSLKPSFNKNSIKELIDYNEFCFPSEERLNANEPNNDGISVTNLRQLMKESSEKIIILDVRDIHEHSISAIKGSLLLPLKEIEKESAEEVIKQLMKSQKVFIYCQSGVRSKKAVKMLKRKGINGININGGMNAWIKEKEIK